MDSIKAVEIMHRAGSQELNVYSSFNMYLINSSKEARWGRRRVKTFFFFLFENSENMQSGRREIESG